jgi:hypothetical protein
MEHSELQSTTRGFYIFADDSTAFGTGKTGLTISVTLAKASQTANAVSVSTQEVGNGWYWITPLAAHRDTLGRALWQFSASGAVIAGRVEKIILANDQLAAFGANTTTPPAEGVIADAVWDEDNRDHLSAHSTGKNLDTIRKGNLLVEGTVLSSPTPTTTVFRISGANYPTGALEHAILWMNTGTSENQNSPILTTVNNGDGTLTITLEEALTTAPVAGDTVLIDPTSHVHAIADIAAGIWSAASSAYSAATGTMGLVMYAFSQMLELVTGVWRWKATALSQAPTGGGGGDASQATLLAIKAKTDLITSQTANQQQTPVNQISITRGDSYSGSTKITRTVTTDYTGYTATFTIRHRVTNAVLLTKAATVDSSTQLSVSLTTTDTAFALLVDATEFGPHPYDFRLVSGSIEKTEPGIAIVKRDVTT